MWSKRTRIMAIAMAMIMCTFLLMKVPNSNALSGNPNVKLVVFTVTRYRSTKEVRFQQSIKTLKALKERGLPVVVVDNSPDSHVRELLSATGAVVSKQQSKGKKGAAFREAAILASQIEGVTGETWICWQEPEKTDMARHWASAVDTTASVVVPFRILANFKKTYPIEQFHSEVFSNMYMDAVAATALKRLRQSRQLPAFPPQIDWAFGPLAFRAAHLGLWREFDGARYDAQIVPIVYAARKGLQVVSSRVPFDASLEMKQQEEGNVHFIEKRLWQLNIIWPAVKKSWETPI